MDRCQLIAPNDLVDDQNLHWIYDDSDVCDVGNDVTKIKTSLRINNVALRLKPIINFKTQSKTSHPHSPLMEHFLKTHSKFKEGKKVKGTRQRYKDEITKMYNTKI